MNCHACERPVGEDDRFCKYCGQPIPQSAPQHAGRQEGLLGGDFDVAALTRLRQEKERLTAELQRMLDGAAGRSMTPDERRAWAALHQRWTEVSADVTQRMQYFNARRAYDRRTQERRLEGRGKSFPALDLPDSVPERRHGDRRQGDRRDPFPEHPP